VVSEFVIVQWCKQHKKLLTPLILIVLSIPIWISIGDHEFNGRSAARYALVSQEMVDSGEWIVPHYLGRIHLTKPPLVYWFESASIRMLGHSFFAVRLPSAIAGTLSLVLLYSFSRKIASDRVAFFATGLYAIMPMTILPARMTVTDSVVNLLWMIVLFTGYLSKHHSDQRRWAIIFWIATSFGMLAKGPVVFIPVGLVGLWWVITNFNIRKSMRIVSFFLLVILAMIPTLIWAYEVIQSEPRALEIWRHETIDRAVGAGDHSRPIWFYIPILLGGCFPASAMLILPGINLRFRHAYANLRSGQLAGFLGWSIVVPLVIFSLISGKLPSYILPICAPLALLSALMLEKWFDNRVPELGDRRRIPEVRYGLLLGTLLFIMGFGVVIWDSYGPEHIVWVSAIVPALIVALVVAVQWKNARFRVLGIGAFIGAWIIGWSVMEEIEDIALSQMSYLSISYQTFGESGWQGETGVYQLEDGIIYWDYNGDLKHFETSQALKVQLQLMHNEQILILTTAVKWEQIKESDAELYAAGKIMSRWEQWPGAPTRYLVVCSSME